MLNEGTSIRAGRSVSVRLTEGEHESPVQSLYGFKTLFCVSDVIVQSLPRLPKHALHSLKWTHETYGSPRKCSTCSRTYVTTKGNCWPTNCWTSAEVVHHSVPFLIVFFYMWRWEWHFLDGSHGLNLWHVQDTNLSKDGMFLSRWVKKAWCISGEGSVCGWVRPVCVCVCGCWMPKKTPGRTQNQNQNL